MRGGKEKNWFLVNVQKRPVPHSSSTTSARNHHFDTEFESHQDGRKSFGCRSGSSADSKKKGVHGVSFHDVLQCNHFIDIVFIGCVDWYSS